MDARCRVSFVVTSRNDDHGGDMLRRFGIFTDALLEQANRHGLAGELIVVEWNPPPGPRLHEVLKLKHKSDSFAVRFIEVPPAGHRAIRNSDIIPLFQMIAKNVGIRRARGEFVIATNPDLLFSDALIAFLAGGRLDAGAMYRLDRHDVGADVPEHVSVADQLAWCERNVLRIHGRRASFAPGEAGMVGRLWRLGRSASRRIAANVVGSARSWRPWRIEGALQALQQITRLYDLGRGALNRLGLRLWKRAVARAYIVYGPRGVLRHAVWLGLRKVLGPPSIHTNACGDFTMLSWDRWAALRGYPELPLWSMHLDSFLCYMAAASGARERELRLPCAMYHMEHGSSWVVMTPEERLLSFARKPWVDIWLLGELWEEAYRTWRPVVPNGEGWGLAGHDLAEVLLISGEYHAIRPRFPLMPASEET